MSNAKKEAARLLPFLLFSDHSAPDLLLPLAEDAREAREDHDACDDPRHEIGNALGQVHALEAQKMRQRKAQRD